MFFNLLTFLSFKLNFFHLFSLLRFFELQCQAFESSWVFLLEGLWNIILNDSSFVHNDNSISLLSKMNGIGHKNNGLSSFMQVSFEAIIENVLSNVRIKST